MLLAIKTFGFVRTTRAQFQHKGLDDINPSDVGWGADDQSTMPAIRNEPTTKGKRVRARVPVQCPTCDKVLNRKADLTRHMQTHDKGAGRFTCPHAPCKYATLQKSNLTTHMRTHTGEKRYSCQDDPGTCNFRTSDPAAFTRHRKKKHDYVPNARSRKGSIATPENDGQNSLNGAPSAVKSPSPHTTMAAQPSTHAPSSTVPTRPAFSLPQVAVIDNNDDCIREEDEEKEEEIDQLADDNYHPSPITSDDDELDHESDDDSLSSSSDSDSEGRFSGGSGGARSPHRSQRPVRRACSRESSVSEVDEFIAKTIDSLKHVVGKRRRGSSAASTSSGLHFPQPATTAAAAPQGQGHSNNRGQGHPHPIPPVPLSFERILNAPPSAPFERPRNDSFS